MIVGIIPARFGSSRLMGKPLASIGGKPMIQHTYESCLKSKLLNKVVVAVDDEKVAQVIQDFGGTAIMTPKTVSTGSDRIAVAAKQIEDIEIIVNIQGDEPFIRGDMIDQAVEPLLFDSSVQITTLAKRIESIDDLKSPAVVKVVFDYQNYAMYFSRSPIPFIRDAKTNLEKITKFDIYKHIGLYAYRKEALFKFTSFEQTDLEEAEKLEQLRILENGMKIKVVETEYETLSVDTPEDLERARNYYNRYIKPKQKKK